VSSGDKKKYEGWYRKSNLIGGIGLAVGVFILALAGDRLRFPWGEEGAFLVAGAIILALLAGGGYVAWMALRAGVRTISKDVVAGKEEAKLEADILRAQRARKEVELLRVKLADAERRLAESDTDTEEFPK